MLCGVLPLVVVGGGFVGEIVVVVVVILISLWWFLVLELGVLRLSQVDIEGGKTVVLVLLVVYQVGVGLHSVVRVGVRGGENCGVGSHSLR